MRSRRGIFVLYPQVTCTPLDMQECRSKQMNVGYPHNLDAYKYPNIMALCAFHIGLEHELNTRSAAAGIMT